MFGINFTFFVAAVQKFELCNSLFYKSLLIRIGSKKHFNLINFILIFWFLFVNFGLQIFYQNILELIVVGVWMQLDYGGFVFGYCSLIVMGILTANLIVYNLKRPSDVYIFSILIPAIFFIFTNISFNVASSMFNQISWLNPLRYPMFIMTESWFTNKPTLIFNLVGSTFFNFDSHWITFKISSGVLNNKSTDISNSIINLDHWKAYGLDFEKFFDLIEPQTQNAIIRGAVNIYLQSGDEYYLKFFGLLILADFSTKTITLIGTIIIVGVLFVLVFIKQPFKRSKYD